MNIKNRKDMGGNLLHLADTRMELMIYIVAAAVLLIFALFNPGFLGWKIALITVAALIIAWIVIKMSYQKSK